MISIKYKVENIKEHRTQVFLVQTPNSLKIHSNGWEAEILQTLGGAATPPPAPSWPDKGRSQDALHMSRALAFTAPAFTSSSLHVTHFLGDDWSVRGTWAGVARGGAGQGGRRGGAEGRGWRGVVRRGGRWLQTNKHGVHLPRESECPRSVGSCLLCRGCGRARYNLLPQSWRGPDRPHPSLAGRGNFVGRAASPTPPPHPLPKRPVPEVSGARDARAAGRE